MGILTIKKVKTSRTSSKQCNAKTDNSRKCQYIVRKIGFSNIVDGKMSIFHRYTQFFSGMKRKKKKKKKKKKK
jgi:hypothetical protein